MDTARILAYQRGALTHDETVAFYRAVLASRHAAWTWKSYVADARHYFGKDV